jgi:TetR/AcrR family transcriptional repressor of bet genes
MSRMTTAPARGRRPVDKYDERRDQLAESALRTLGELGYARSSLREIAQNSPFSHGVVHYYFRDKTELITYCVRYYKAQCVTRYDDLVHDSTDADGLATGFADRLAETLVDDAPMHRLWYDLRSQSLFEDTLREDVELIDDTLEQMVWRVVDRYAELAGRPLTVDSGTAYALLDGLFEQALLDATAGRTDAPRTLSQRALALLRVLVA